LKRVAFVGLAVVAVLGGLAAGMLTASGAGPTASTPANSGLVANLGSAPPSTPPVDVPPASAEPSCATPEPTPTPSPTPVVVAAPLTGRMVSPTAAARHPIAVMVDDLSPARPQSGFNYASIVWQAPAEGGIPRYMMVFQEYVPPDVGPVRSSRYYYIAWASELKAVYAHAGGSPQALATLRAKGNGQLVYNADEFRWGKYFRRSATPKTYNGGPRFAPHNLYTTGKQLRQIAGNVKAADGPIKWPWTFAPDKPLEQRPVGGKIQVYYAQNVIAYTYDRATNTYLRSNTSEKKQIDASNRKRVAPKNVIVMYMHFGPLNDGSKKHRLEATVTGSGPAWIATNGVTTKGTWKKTSLTSPTRFFDSKGKPVTLTVGQTFVQVMPWGSKLTFVKGKPAPTPAAPAASPSEPAASPSSSPC